MDSYICLALLALNPVVYRQTAPFDAASNICQPLLEGGKASTNASAIPRWVSCIGELGRIYMARQGVDCAKPEWYCNDDMLKLVTQVRPCRLTVSIPVLQASMVSALETRI
jgi:hypothetical protein